RAADADGERAAAVVARPRRLARAEMPRSVVVVVIVVAFVHAGLLRTGTAASKVGREAPRRRPGAARTAPARPGPPGGPRRAPPPVCRRARAARPGPRGGRSAPGAPPRTARPAAWCGARASRRRRRMRPAPRRPLPERAPGERARARGRRSRGTPRRRRGG